MWEHGEYEHPRLFTVCRLCIDLRLAINKGMQINAELILEQCVAMVAAPHLRRIRHERTFTSFSSGNDDAIQGTAR